MLSYKVSALILENMVVAWRGSSRKKRLEMMKVRDGIILQLVSVPCVIAVQQRGLQL